MRAALLLALLAFLPGSLDAFGSPKAAAVRVIGLALAAGLVAAWLAARIRREPAPRCTMLDLTLLGWVAASALSCAFAASPHVGWWGELGERDGLLTTLALAGLHAGARVGHPDTRDAERTFGVLLAGITLAATYALFQLAGLDPVPWADPTAYRSGGASVLRPGGTLGLATTFGAVAALGLALTLARVLTGRAPAWREAPVAALLAGALVATLSRGAWIAGAVAVLAAAVLAARVVRPAAWGSRALAPAAAVFVAGAVLATRAGPVAARLAEGTADASGSGATRVLFARAALDMLRAHPLTGVGPDGFGLAFPALQTAELWRGAWLGLPGHAHAVALQVLATRGALGALAGLAVAVALALTVATRLRARDPLGAPLAAAMLALGTAALFNVVGVAGAACVAVLAGLAPAAAPAPRGRTGVAVAWLGAVVLAAGAFAEARALLDAGLAKAAITASIAASPPAQPRWYLLADTAATLAVARRPHDDAVWRIASDAALLRGGAALAAGDTARAAACAARAVRTADAALARVGSRAMNLHRRAAALVLVARSERRPQARAAAAGRARIAWSRALAAAPVDGLVRIAFVRDAVALGWLDAALAESRRVAALYPEASPGHALEAQVLHALGRDAEAAVAAARARAARPE